MLQMWGTNVSLDLMGALKGEVALPPTALSTRTVLALHLRCQMPCSSFLRTLWRHVGPFSPVTELYLEHKPH